MKTIETKPASHTPGPWKWGSPHLALSGQYGQVICWSVNERGEQWAPVNGSVADTNCRLLAAAPDLLNAAKIGLACCIAWGGKCEAKGEMELAKESVTRAEQIRAAISKAEKTAQLP